MSRRGSKRTPFSFLNGWMIERCPRTFAEQHTHEVRALNAKGFTVEKHGFQTLKAARVFARTTALPENAIPHTSMEHI